MEPEKDNYKRILGLLRNSEPEMKHQEELVNEVMEKLSPAKRRSFRLTDLPESLFAWVYIPWVRRTLVTVAVMLVAIFIYQQSVLVRQVKNINRQAVIIRNEMWAVPESVPGTRVNLYRASGLIFSGQEIRIPEKDLMQILDEYSDVKGKYTDLIRIIEENPALKEYVERKLDERKNNKPEI